MALSSQILLPLEDRRPDRFEDFIAGPNEGVVAAMQELLDAREGCLFIRGAEGSGKSHLLNATCNLAQDKGLQAFFLSSASVPESAAGGLAGLEEMDLVCIDDIDHLVGQAAWENALFHFFNRFRARNGRLVISSTRPLSGLPFVLPDLESRLAWGLRLQLEALNDDEKAAVLRSKARALNIELPSDVVYYLLSRGSRNVAALVSNFEAVRVAAFAGKRRMTVPLAREVLSPSEPGARQGRFTSLDKGGGKHEDQA